MTDIGVSCHKDSYGRGVGKVLTCTKDQEQQAGLCYEPCDHSASGVGPVCWGHCPAGTSPCGDFLCLDQYEECTASVIADTASIGSLIWDVATDPFSTKPIIDIATIAVSFGYSECSSW